MSGAIEECLNRETWINLGPSEETYAAARAELATLRAELAAKDATIERLREALEGLDTSDVPADEPPACVALRLHTMILKARAALSSLPPSDMRLVPVERLREIAELVNGLGYAPDWLADAIKENRV